MCPDDCNQRGVCHGSEGCRCELGFWGRACDGVCPGTANKPCGGPYQGVCQPDGKCVCHDGFFGEDCMQTCPRTDLGLCNNQGYCDSKIGSCSCKTGWYGTHCEKRMQSPDPANTVEILLNDCRASDGEWLFALLDKIATHFEVTPQRLQFKSCIDVVCNSDGSNCIPARRAGLQMLPLELYGVPGQTSSAEIAQNISLE